MKRFVVGVGILWASLSGVAIGAASIGKMAPSFELKGADGKPHNLKEYLGQGKTVVLEWWNYKCPFVKKHYESNNMQKLQKKYAANVVWLTINSSAKNKQGHVSGNEAKKLLADMGAKPTEVLLDHNGKVGRLYAAKTTPHMYIINPEGMLIYKGAIDSNSSANKADIPASTNYVDQALDSHLKGKPIKVATSKPYGCSVKY